MPNIARPKILPKVTYAPPNDPPPENTYAEDGFDPRYYQGGRYGGGVGVYDYEHGGSDPSRVTGAPPTGYQEPDYRDYITNAQRAIGMGTPIDPRDYAPVSDQNDRHNARPAPSAPVGIDTRKEDVADAHDARLQAARLQDAVTKNQTLTQQAKDTGNTQELQRLQAEWERIKPLAEARGISAQRLVNSYMQPDNPAAKGDFRSALAAAIADDEWGKQATMAFGRPPNQLEWDEHWKAMNVGGRDPLEGHPQAVQNLQAAMNDLQRQNQQSAYGQYQHWLAGQ